MVLVSSAASVEVVDALLAALLEFAYQGVGFVCIFDEDNALVEFAGSQDLS